MSKTYFTHAIAVANRTNSTEVTRILRQLGVKPLRVIHTLLTKRIEWPASAMAAATDYFENKRAAREQAAITTAAAIEQARAAETTPEQAVAPAVVSFGEASPSKPPQVSAMERFDRIAAKLEMMQQHIQKLADSWGVSLSPDAGDLDLPLDD